MPIRFSIISVILLFHSLVAFAESESDTSGYRLLIDIKNISNDQIHVLLYAPQLVGDSAVYNMPKIVPGTYSISNFGRFVINFKAIDDDGEPLATRQIDQNRWSIANPSTLDFLSYDVIDTYDEPGAAGIFEPAGTNIEQGKNIVFNPFGFAGYFDEQKNRAYTLEITRPKNFYGETSMQRVRSNDSIDVFSSADYFSYHDNPILYSTPDTSSMMVGNTRIAVAVYSPKGVIKSMDVLNTLRDLFPAAAHYLGGTLPVDQYTVLLYCSNGATGTGSFGALEHTKSTVFVLPEAPIEALAKTIKDVVAHEFFHIVTPLSIHSKEIDDYDFMNPKMSQHLWLYEGTTEYAAHHMQLKEGLISLNAFLQIMREKIQASSQYDTGLAFTEMSKKALGEHQDQYGNVYQKGALIGLAIDLKLRQLSRGAYGIQDLMRALSQKYGPDKPFEDDSLFSEIGLVSGYPVMQPFLEKYVAGTEPLPLRNLLDYVGIAYIDSITEYAISGGNITIGYNPQTEKMIVVSTNSLDKFGKDLGFRPGDALLEWNGNVLTLDNIQSVLNTYKSSAQEGEKMSVLIQREKANNKKVYKKLHARAQKIFVTRRDVLEPMAAPNDSQLEARKQWMGEGTIPN